MSLWKVWSRLLVEWPKSSDEEGGNELLIDPIREENADQFTDTGIALSETNLFEQDDVNFMVGETRKEDIEHVPSLEGLGQTSCKDSQPRLWITLQIAKIQRMALLLHLWFL